MITELLKNMFDDKKVESVLVNGFAVIQTLLEYKRIGYVLYSHIYRTYTLYSSFCNINCVTNFMQMMQCNLDLYILEVNLRCCRPEGSTETPSGDGEQVSKGVANTSEALTPRLGDINQLLIEPPSVSTFILVPFLCL